MKKFSLRTFYNTKLLRERVLMLVFLGIGVIWWGPALITRIRLNVQSWNSAMVDKKDQQDWLAMDASVRERTAKMTQQLEPAKTMNASQAYGQINVLAAGLPVEMGAQRTEPTDNFSLHSMQVTLRRTDMASLLKFYEGVTARTPYLGIEQATITADRASPGMVSAVFRIYSVEVRNPTP